MGDVAVETVTKLDARALRADFPIFEQKFARQAARLPRLGRELAEAAPDARGDEPLLRDVVRERPSRRLRARRARDRGARARARADARLPQRAVDARDDLRPQRDRGDQPRRVRVGALEPPARRSRGRDRARAPLELRPVAVHRAGRPAPSCASCRSTSTASSTSPASTRSRARATSGSSRPASSRTRSGRSTPSTSSSRGRTSRARSSSATARRRRRT